MLGVNDHIELEILRLTGGGGGRGLGKHEGKVVFVPFSVPGDRLLVKIVKSKKKFCEAEIVKILQASKKRITPPCPVFTKCGGCSWQMISYSEQVQHKQALFNYEVKKINPEIELEDIQKSPKEFRYRNRVQLHQKGKQLGFFAKGSHKLVDIEDCFITDEKLVNEFAKIKNLTKNRRFELALTAEGEVVIRNEVKQEHQNLFNQINEGINSILIEYVLNTVRDLKEVRLLFDLYAGSGNFSFPLAKEFTSVNVVSVELSKVSVKKAQSKNTLSNLSFVEGDVGWFLKSNAQNPDLILLDPPRVGADKRVMNMIREKSPRYVLYISCNLATQIRDIKILEGRYKIKRAKAFDMFPQTDHMETLLLLEKVE